MAEFITVAKTSDIPPGQAVVVDVEDLSIVIGHVEDEGFFAIADLCSHDGGPLGDCDLQGASIECPRHGARFDVRTGAALTMPAIVPVEVYQVRVVGDEIQVVI
ncbi:MAG: non-heme iron oxygenase ferredoxin subunit [Ardenticatenales bacterium]|nr:non-heme iron oxygenase ferredoxin subunit [Ardenticatenales bacterium]